MFACDKLTHVDIYNIHYVLRTNNVTHRYVVCLQCLQAGTSSQRHRRSSFLSRSLAHPRTVNSLVFVVCYVLFRYVRVCAYVVRSSSIIIQVSSCNYSLVYVCSIDRRRGCMDC